MVLCKLNNSQFCVILGKGQNIYTFFNKNEPFPLKLRIYCREYVSVYEDYYPFSNYLLSIDSEVY